MGSSQVTWAGPGQGVVRQVEQVGWHAVCCSMLLCAAVCCCVLLRAAVCCCVLQSSLFSLTVFIPALRLLRQQTPFQVRVHMSETQVTSLCVSTSYPCVCVNHIPVCVCVCLNHSPVCLNHMARRLEERLVTWKSERAAWHSARCVVFICVYMYIYIYVYLYIFRRSGFLIPINDWGRLCDSYYICIYRERQRQSVRGTCTHQQDSDPREILALPRATVCGNAPNESRAHMGICTYTHMYKYMCIYIFIYIFIHTHTHTHTQIYSFVCQGASINVPWHIHKCTMTHSYTCTVKLVGSNSHRLVVIRRDILLMALSQLLPFTIALLSNGMGWLRLVGSI